MPTATAGLVSGRTIKTGVRKTLATLSREERAQRGFWNTKKNELLQKVLTSTTALSELLTRAQAELQPLFEDAGVKDQLFKFFYGRRIGSSHEIGSRCKRIGKFFFLPIFLVEVEEKSNLFAGPLVLVWNICTAQISFKIYANVSDNTGSGSELRNTFLNAAEIADIRKLILDATMRIPDAEQEQLIAKYNEPYIFFLDKLRKSEVLTHTLIDTLIQSHAEVFTMRRVKNMVFSKRDPAYPLTENDTGCCHSFLDDSNQARENLEDLSEYLFDEGYPDVQVIQVDTARFDLDSLRWRRKTVQFVRRQLALWNDHKDILSDEPNSYASYSYYGAGD